MENLIKHFLAILIISFAAISCSSSESGYSEIKFATGTIKFLSFEGGFYGIITDDNKNLDPLNLPKEFQVEGKRVYLKYREKKEVASFHMWGAIIKIIEISELK